jgi:hypothetical protein
MYEVEIGFASNDMIGSASASRSYGFTHGSMLPHADNVEMAREQSNRRRVKLNCALNRLLLMISASLFE